MKLREWNMVPALDDILSSRPAVTVIADDPASAALAQQAVTLAGGRVLSTSRWTDAAELIGSQSDVRLVLAETRDVPDETLAATIAAVAAAARAADARLMVALDGYQIDLVAGQLIDGVTSLMCAPTLAEGVAAAAVAFAEGDRKTLHDASSETTRLDRLNEEVARIAETLARLSPGDDAAPAAPGLIGAKTLAHGATLPAEANADASEIRRTIRSRRMRSEIFGIEGLFEDPAWDMLLDLYAARIEHRRVSVSSLCIAAAVAPTTALRWIGKLIEFGLLERQPDPFDRRRAFIVLTDRTATAMANYVAAVRQAGLAIA
jgi:DNA-binding MarR family transcriptional regulator